MTHDEPPLQPLKPEEVLDLLLEVQSFDRIPRLGFLQRGVSDVESVCEHSWHVAFLVSRLGRHVDGLDRLLAIELALEHDLAEMRTGDLPKPVARFLDDGSKRTLETRVLEELGRPFAEALVSSGVHHSTREHRFVKACDRLQLAIKAAAYEQAGYRLCGELLDSVLERPEGTDNTSAQAARSRGSEGTSASSSEHREDRSEFPVIDALLLELASRRNGAPSGNSAVG